MKKIYAPWREGYVTNTVHKPGEERKKHACVFCHQLEQNNDEAYFILKRYKHTFVMLNLYPYNGGHLMVLPIAHKPTLNECCPDTRSEIIEVTNTCINILEKELKPQGYNVGFNMGKAGGGGIPSHLHIHIIPRWESDTNFLAIIGETKPISVDLKKLYKTLSSLF